MTTREYGFTVSGTPDQLSRAFSSTGTVSVPTLRIMGGAIQRTKRRAFAFGFIFGVLVAALAHVI